jgi:hypothetical protein
MFPVSSFVIISHSASALDTASLHKHTKRRYYLPVKLSATRKTPLKVRGPFAKFMDSPYYYDSVLCGVVVTVSFSKYLPWQATRFLQRYTHFSKTRCRPLITSKFLTSELPFHGWKSPEIAWGEIWTVWRMFWWVSTDTQNSIQISPHEKGAPRQEISKWSTICNTFSRSGWCVVRSASLAKGGTSKKRPSPHLHKVPTRSNKASLRTFQTILVAPPSQRGFFLKRP